MKCSNLRCRGSNPAAQHSGSKMQRFVRRRHRVRRRSGGAGAGRSELDPGVAGCAGSGRAFARAAARDVYLTVSSAGFTDMPPSWTQPLQALSGVRTAQRPPEPASGRDSFIKFFVIACRANGNWCDKRKTAQSEAIRGKPSAVRLIKWSGDGERNRTRNMIMQRLFAAVVAVTCIVASTPSFARGGFAHGGGNGFVRNPTVLLGTGTPQAPAAASRIPAPLAAPSPAPVINGPMSQPAFRGLSGIGQ